MVSISGIKRGNQKWKLSTSADDPITRAAARALWRINEDEWRRRQRRRRVAPFPRKKRKNSIIKKKGEGNEIKIYSFTGLQVNTRIEWKFQRIFFLKIIRKINEKSRKVSGQNDIESVCVCVCVLSRRKRTRRHGNDLGRSPHPARRVKRSVSDTPSPNNFHSKWIHSAARISFEVQRCRLESQPKQFTCRAQSTDLRPKSICRFFWKTFVSYSPLGVYNKKNNAQMQILLRVKLLSKLDSHTRRHWQYEAWHVSSCLFQKSKLNEFFFQI